MALLYNNNVKISLRNKEIITNFCAVSKGYYGVKESPLHEHRDVCPFMRTLLYSYFEYV
jgi:hypothetical protein